MNLNVLKSIACRRFGKAALTLRRYSPEIATGAGIVLGIGCVVVACVQTTKLGKTLDETKDRIDDIHETHAQKPEEYTDKMVKSDLTKVYLRSGVDILRIYALPAGLGILSVTCIIGGHNLLRKENAAITAAYIALNESYKEYRRRVKNDLGTEKDREYYYGERKEERVNVDMETGEATTEEVTIRDTNHISVYARYFDRGNDNWCKSPAASLAFLRGVQNYCNDKLHCYGHLFLNEVYDELGLPRSEAGQYVGWVMGEGDDFVDFGLYDANSPEGRRFINGDEDAVLLDFNVDGPIMHIFESLKTEKDKLRGC